MKHALGCAVALLALSCSGTEVAPQSAEPAETAALPEYEELTTLPGGCTSNQDCPAGQRCFWGRFNNICVASCTMDSDCPMDHVCTPISWPDTDSKYCVPKNQFTQCEYRQVTRCTVEVIAQQIVCYKTRVIRQENRHLGDTCGQTHANMDCPNTPVDGACPINLPEICYAKPR